MPKDLKDFPRPPGDNGRGLHGIASIGWTGGKEGYDFWINELVAMGVKWFKVLDSGGDSIVLCEKLLAAEIFPIVRIIRRDPPPNDTPEPNPGHINAAEEETIRRLIGVGVRYFETNNEPNLAAEWKSGAMPGDTFESAKLVALNWLFDARFVLAAGGYPGLPAVSIGGNMDLMGALVSLGRQDILLEGCWIALHNYCLNHPVDYPDDPINRTGQPITAPEYDQGAYTQWAWWNNATGRADSIDEINALRAAGKNPTQTTQQDHSCFREFEYYNALALKYLGRSIPILSTEGGYWIGRREDARYPRITPQSQGELTVAMFDYMQRQSPDYYFAAAPWLMLESQGWETDAWYSSFWKRAFQQGSDGRNGIPPLTVPGAALGERLPVIDAVKAMPNLARRLPGVQPAPPPVQPPVVAAPKAAPLKYVVMPGDTLSKIAKQFGTSWKDIAALNQIAASNQLRAGQTLLVPRPVDSVPSAGPETLPSPPPAQAGLSALFPDNEPEPEATAQVAPPPPAPAPIPPAPPASPLKPVQPPTPPAPVPVAPSVAETPPPPAAIEPTPLPAPAPLPPAPPAPSVKPVQPPAPVPVTPPVVATPPTPTAVGPMPPPAPAPLPPAPPEPAFKPVQPPTPPAPTAAEPTLSPQPVLAPPPKLAASDAARIELEWDWRLDALGVLVQEANVSPGQEYWKLMRAVYQGPDESGGNHHIYYVVLDENGQPVANQKVWQGWRDDKTDAATNEAGETNIPLWASYMPGRESGPYLAWVDGLPSDCVIGMGLPLQRHVNFLLTWQRTVA